MFSGIDVGQWSLPIILLLDALSGDKRIGTQTSAVQVIYLWCFGYCTCLVCRFGYVCSISWHERIRHYIVEQLPGGKVQLFGHPGVFEDLHKFVEFYR